MVLAGSGELADSILCVESETVVIRFELLVQVLRVWEGLSFQTVPHSGLVVGFVVAVDSVRMYLCSEYRNVEKFQFGQADRTAVVKFRPRGSLRSLEAAQE